MCNWLVEVQKEDGGINQGSIKDRDKNPSVIFNTGMVMLGWIEAFKRTNDKKYLNALIRAGDFLSELRKDNQLWLKYCYNNIPHTYHSRVAWAILDLYSLTKKQIYLDCAQDIYSWVLSQQKDNGFFENCCFESDVRTCSNTHGIAYTLRGLLEGYLILNNKRYLDSVLKTSETIMKKFEISKFFPTSYNAKWKVVVKPECLTGIAQHSIIWFKLYQITNDIRFLNAGLDGTDLLCYLQNTNSRFKEVNGAIKGSHPIWGFYAPLQYPNWAAKFFADALILRQLITKELEGELL
ncbi:MAG: beta-L-arabinofuranosidase domain-containing protein [Promethearchaeota archaeon]